MTAPRPLRPLDDVARRLLFHDARTANAFTDEPVTDEQLRTVHDLVRWPPTAANTQPLRIVFVRSREAKDRLLPLMSGGNREKTASAPVTALLGADVRFWEHWDRLFPHKPGSGGKFADAPEQAEAMARFNGALQAGYFVLAVRAAGLAAGPMAGYDHEGVEREFFPGGRVRSLVVVNLGHPAEDAWQDRLPRLDHDEVVTVL